MTNREFFVKRWTGEYPAFVKVMKALPKDRLDYRPHARSRSAAELVWLLTLKEAAGSALIDTGRIDWKEPPPPPPGSLEEMIAAFERAHAELATRLGKLDEAAWDRKAALSLHGRRTGFVVPAAHRRPAIGTKPPAAARGLLTCGSVASVKHVFQGARRDETLRVPDSVHPCGLGPLSRCRRVGPARKHRDSR